MSDPYKDPIESRLTALEEATKDTAHTCDERFRVGPKPFAFKFVFDPSDVLLSLATLLVVGFGVWVVYKIVSADTSPRGCYLDSASDGTMRVSIDIDWRNDPNFPVKNVDEALEAAKKLGCRVDFLKDAQVQK